MLSRPGGPTTTDRRRAVSTIYYALFASLSKCCADLLVGSSPEATKRPAWMQAYRSLEHKIIFARCGDKAVIGDLAEPGIIDFAYQLRLMQHHRFLSDYAYDFEPKLSTVWEYLDVSRTAIMNFHACSEFGKREFVVSLAIKHQLHRQKDEPKPLSR